MNQSEEFPWELINLLSFTSEQIKGELRAINSLKTKSPITQIQLEILRKSIMKTHFLSLAHTKTTKWKIRYEICWILLIIYLHKFENEKRKFNFEIYSEFLFKHLLLSYCPRILIFFNYSIGWRVYS